MWRMVMMATVMAIGFLGMTESRAVAQIDHVGAVSQPLIHDRRHVHRHHLLKR